MPLLFISTGIIIIALASFIMKYSVWLGILGFVIAFFTIGIGVYFIFNIGEGK